MVTLPCLFQPHQRHSKPAGTLAIVLSCLDTQSHFMCCELGVVIPISQRRPLGLLVAKSHAQGTGAVLGLSG